MYYWPMLGIRYAFYDYKPVGAPTFVGLKHFYSMFKTDAFWSAFRNTLELSIMKLLITTFTAVIVSMKWEISLQRKLCRLLYICPTLCHGQ